MRLQASLGDRGLPWCVISKYRNVLALVSNHTSLIVRLRSDRDLSSYLDNEDQPLFNRAAVKCPMDLF